MTLSLSTAFVGRGAKPGSVRSLQQWADEPSEAGGDPAYDRSRAELDILRRDLFPYKSIRKLIESVAWPSDWAWQDQWGDNYLEIIGKIGELTWALAGETDPIVIEEMAKEIKDLEASLPPSPDYCDQPSDMTPAFWGNAVNGVTHDDTYWYFSSVVRDETPIVPVIDPATGDTTYAENSSILFRVPRSSGFSLFDRPDVSTSLPSPLFDAYCHYGDIDHFNGEIWVPAEPDCAGSRDPLLPRFSVFKAPGLEFSRTFEVKSTWQNGAAWVAVNPLNGLLYSSNFDSGDSPATINVYAEQAGELFLVGRLPVLDHKGSPRTLHNVQGGSFSPLGHLYLVLDDGAGVHGFDIVTGRLSAGFWVRYSPNRDTVGDIERGVFGTEQQELEGLTLWTTPVTGCDGGPFHIHVLMVANDTKLYFKHYQTSDPANL